MKENRFLQMAFELAQVRRGFTAPNPAVGAVLVKEEQVISSGTHWASGHPHAEIEAIQMAKKRGLGLTGATLYVSLEPCCHFGKTPPCTDAIIQNGIKKVVYAFSDPNPLVNGRGSEVLREAGVEVEKQSVLSINQFYESYGYWTENKKSWMTGKLAMTADGVTASLNEERLLISGEEAYRNTHLRRRFSDAILTSLKTVKKDDPQLTSRLEEEVNRPVYILDKNLEFHRGFQLAKKPERISLLHLATQDKSRKNQLESDGFECIEVAEENGQIALGPLPHFFGEKGFHEVWVELGVTLFHEFIKKQLFQEIVLYQSKKSQKGLLPFDPQLLALSNYNLIEELDWNVDIKRTYLQIGLRNGK